MGAFSGVTLIAIAIGVFVILVSAQVFHDWPIAALTGHSGDSAVAPAKAVTGEAQTASTGGAAATPTTTSAAPATTAPPPPVHHHKQLAKADSTGPATAVEAASQPSAVGDEASTGAGESGSSSKSSGPAPSTEAGSTSSSSGGASGTTTATGSSGSTGTKPTSGGGTTTTKPVETVTEAKPSETITGTVNGTVSGVDQEALGGTLEKTGVTEVTEAVVNGVAGPESVVGKTVDGVGETVKGLLGGGEH